MDEAFLPHSFLIDIELWQKFNLELRAACHWCTHHYTTTPAEAATLLEQGEGWPRDWIPRKVKNSTRQLGGLFMCPAPDYAGHSNPRGERRRRWFCRFCIDRHLGVDLKNFFQFDEVQGQWIQVCVFPRRFGPARCVLLVWVVGHLFGTFLVGCIVDHLFYSCWSFEIILHFSSSKNSNSLIGSSGITVHCRLKKRRLNHLIPNITARTTPVEVRLIVDGCCVVILRIEIHVVKIME